MTNTMTYLLLLFDVAASMYSREDTVNWLLAKRANTNSLGGPLKQSAIHLASARRSGQAAQVCEDNIIYLSEIIRESNYLMKD